jgi:hypothetical protein
MYSKPVKGTTPKSLDMSHHLHNLSGSPHKASPESLQAQAAKGRCAHGHSITGPYETIKRFLPEYMGGHPQSGYMLDVCKMCFQELQERPYNPTRPQRGH